MMNTHSTHPNETARENNETRAVFRRRMQEEDRKKRIFNAKTRTLGVDVEGLEQQIQDKLTTQEIEHERDEAFADRMTTAEYRVMLLDREAARARNEVLKNQEDYRRLYQRKDQRREWDLSDPDSLRKDRPAREGDNDPRLGPSCLQKFGGEDLNHGPRVRKQQQQLSNWVKQQMAETERTYTMKKEMDVIEAERAAEIAERRAQMEEAEIASRQRMNIAVQDYNRALAEARRESTRIQQQDEMADSLEEVHNNLRSDFLNENPNTTKSSIAPHRVLKYHWKGLSPEQLEEIRETQRRQVAEKALMHQQQREEDGQWDLVQEAVRRNMIAGEREVARRRSELNRHMLAEQKRQADEQKEQRHHLDKVVYTNAPTAAYFAQFGTSTR